MASVYSGRKLFWSDESVLLYLLRRKGTCKECVLASQQPASLKQNPVPVRIQGQRLSHRFARTGAVFNGQVLCCKIMGVYQHAVSPKGPPLTAVLHGHSGRQSTGNDGAAG